MASNESMVSRERRGVIRIGEDYVKYVKISEEDYAVMKAKAELYDEYLKQSRFYNKTVNKNHEDDGK